MTEKIPEKSVIVLAIVFEGVLCSAAVGWAVFRGLDLPVDLSVVLVLQGIAWALPLLLFNLILYFYAGKISALAPFKRFLDEIIVPICSVLSPGGALIVALCSGIGEEVFFRGVLNTEWEELLFFPAGIIFSSFIFAYLHLIGRVREFLPLLPLYFLIGIYLSATVELSESLIPAIICHSFYNFTAIIFIRYLVVRKLLDGNQDPGS